MIGKLNREDKEAYLVTYKKTVKWGEIDLLEGEGCGYFSKSDMVKLPSSELFKDLIKLLE